MNELFLLRTSIIVAIAAIVALFFISQFYKPETIKTYDVGKKQENKIVKIKGTVGSIAEKGNLVLLEVYEPKSVTVVMFNDGKQHNFASGSSIEVIGRVREYKGKYEVIAEKVK